MLLDSIQTVAHLAEVGYLVADLRTGQLGVLKQIAQLGSHLFELILQIQFVCGETGALVNELANLFFLRTYLLALALFVVELKRLNFTFKFLFQFVSRTLVLHQVRQLNVVLDAQVPDFVPQLLQLLARGRLLRLLLP